MSPPSAKRPANTHPRRNRKKRNWFRIILCLMLLALMGEMVFLALTSPRFRISRIDIRGAKVVPVTDLRERAKSALGSNLFLADTNRVRRNVLREPALKSATVYRFPLNRLIVHVRERETFAVVAANGHFYLMDKDGFVYRRVKTNPAESLTLELPGNQPVRVGAKPRTSLLESFTQALEASTKNDFRPNKISVDPANDICLNMESGLRVKLGPAIDLEEKFTVLKEIIARKSEIASEAEYIDLRCPTAPAWKARN